MSHKRPTKGTNKRRSTARTKQSTLAQANQSKYDSLIKGLKAAAQGIADSYAILLLSPKIFNVRPLIASGQIDPAKLRASEMVVHGQAIIGAIDGLKEEGDSICKSIKLFTDIAEKIDVNQAGTDRLMMLNMEMMKYHQRCEAWLIDFGARVHSPLMDSVVILNEAVIGQKADLSNAQAFTNAVKDIATAIEEADNVNQ